MKLSVFITLALTVFGTSTTAEITWPLDQYDPAAKTDPAAKANLILPMPCGGAMAFQKVVVPVEANNPLDDRLLRLGQSQAQTGYSDYFRPAFLRGAFSDDKTGDTHYYIARYELTRGQYLALTGACPKAKGRDRFAQGNLTWFNAVDLGRHYTEWLMQNARDQLPKQEDAYGFLRLPTEEEWEYATRGGVQIDAAKFPARRFSGDTDLRDFSRYQAAGSARGKIGAVGTRKPNPLGLFDVYGNAEELMLEPFRLNAIGRHHGQVGGLVTRGGSFLSVDAQIYSAQRTEYPMFSNTNGTALSATTFGVRFVVSSHVATSDQRLSTIQSTWVQLSNSNDTAAQEDPISRLAKLIENEVDPRRKSALNDLQLDLRVSRETALTAQKETAKSALLSGGMFVQALNDSAAQIERLKFNIGNLTDMARVSTGASRSQFTTAVEGYVQEIVGKRRAQNSVLLTFRSVIDTLVAEVSAAERKAAYDLLRRELTAGSQIEILTLVDRFWKDLNIYLEQPDMTPKKLLQIAISP